MADKVRIGAFVETDNPEYAARTAEVLARAAAGLLLEGIPVALIMTTEDQFE